MSGRSVKNLQLGVGKSVIVDLPEDASEIYVGDPRIANAIVRSARRIYVSGYRERPNDDLRPEPGGSEDRGRRGLGRS